MLSDSTHTVLRDAARAFCTDVPLVERLAAAHARLSTIDSARDLPDALRVRFDELIADIAYGADSVNEAVARMSTGDRERLAERVVGLYVQAAGMVDREE